jgi:plastocyanin
LSVTAIFYFCGIAFSCIAFFSFTFVYLGILLSMVFALGSEMKHLNIKKNNPEITTSVILLTGILAATPLFALAQEEEQQQPQNMTTAATEQQQQPTDSAAGQSSTAATTTVDAGGGGPESVVIAFIPQNVTINAGETVVWTNPTIVSEPHTVTFVRQEDYFANFESPFLIANGTEITPANPEEKNTEPLIIPSQNDTANNIIVAANARSTNPVVIDAQNNVTYLPPNANYTMTGDELYVNSGWMWPEGQAPPGAPPIKSFSVTFANAGTYPYLCLVHPWMTGQVVVQ